MSVDRRLLNWGVFLVLVGGVPLAVHQGWIPRDLVARAWELWPLFLVGAGIGLILRATPLRPLGGIVVAATAGVIIGATVAVGIGGFSVGAFGCGPAATGAPRLLAQDGTFGGTTATVTLNARCASLEVGTASGSGWSIDVSGDESARPAVDAAADRLDVRSPSTPTALPFGATRATWQATLGTGTGMDLTLHLDGGDATVDLGGANLSRLAVEGNAIGDTRIDLSNAHVGQLQVSANAASAAILLPAAGTLTGTIDANAASIELCAPSGVGLRLVPDQNITASNNYGARGLARNGDAWETAGYASAAARVELRTMGSAVSFTLNPEDGCR